MKRLETAFTDVWLIEPRIFRDARGESFEAWNRRRFAELGLAADFVQDNHSRSARNTLRGLHYQLDPPQGKLVRVISGEIFDVVVDLRRSSPSFGRWLGVSLTAEQSRLLWIPPGFAHGFCVLSESAVVLYKVTAYWSPASERCLAWNDPRLAITWPLDGPPILSARDAAGLPFARCETFP
ncbi:MAG: dTDP-4-dehydrorhamnose 3,5-epimerase [Betaproteobacteria bacterium HGW-Betaproteobacteria-11]|nr:MAG: dTDP-4-dehydrorhamnose 3,5-epimerase [Betaproteobacteria bacterium HGW-Betaproteobacteria-11]